jgi:hypothetical protein
MGFEELDLEIKAKKLVSTEMAMKKKDGSEVIVEKEEYKYVLVADNGTKLGLTSEKEYSLGDLFVLNQVSAQTRLDAKPSKKK